ncbi:MAG: magnesium transporter CorA family protein [Clostridia bacterium]|nr:magnesium transporter CorA family protein [Clostridia bacterium]
MLTVYKRELDGDILRKTSTIERGCWINLEKPNEKEIDEVIKKTGVLEEYVRCSLDEEERARVDTEDNETLIILDMPYTFKDDDEEKQSTIPMGIIITEDYIVTVCSVQNDIIEKMISLNKKNLFSYKKTRLAIQMILSIAKEFLRRLRIIEKQLNRLEDDAREKAENREVFKLLEIQNTLVYFTTSLKGNEIIMEKLMRTPNVKMYEEDQDVLEDAIIENRQAIEMASIYQQITMGLVDAFGSIISNNLNEVMKFLASLTIVLSIPTMIFSFYGMNVPLPLEGSPYAIILILVGTALLTYVSYFILKKSKLI